MKSTQDSHQQHSLQRWRNRNHLQLRFNNFNNIREGSKNHKNSNLKLTIFFCVNYLPDSSSSRIWYYKNVHNCIQLLIKFIKFKHPINIKWLGRKDHWIIWNTSFDVQFLSSSSSACFVWSMIQTLWDQQYCNHLEHHWSHQSTPSPAEETACLWAEIIWWTFYCWWWWLLGKV